jgi:hypothetical protein
MEWFSQNWVWVLFFAGMIAMHMFGHGGHGGHGGHSGGCGGGHDDPKPAIKDGVQRTSEQAPGHQH